MEEIAGFVGEGREDATIFAGAARFYERIAAERTGGAREGGTHRFLQSPGSFGVIN